MYDEEHFTHDAAVVSFDDEADGITVDEESGEIEFDWDEVETVTIDTPPHADAFDSKQFYKLPATVAKPIPQPYSYGEDSITWLKKPREELKTAAWSLDNAPWTMGHPETGMVKSIHDVSGFWRNPRYMDSLDDLDADLHVPVGDEEAKQYIAENGDVSVGFYNKIARVDEYDGVVGGTDDEQIEIEGYQTDMLFDHVASVSVGRCSGSQGCGIDDHNHGHIDSSFKSGTATIHKDDEADGGESSSDTFMELDQSNHTHEGSWYAVPPSDNPDDEWKFPIDNCSDVEDAWQLRNHGDISIEVSTLESRIRQRASDLGCDVDLGDEESSDAADLDDTMTEETNDCGCGGDDTPDDNTDSNNMQIEFDDLSTEAALAKIEEQHDGVAEHLDGLRSYEEAASAAEEAADELDIDDVTNLADSVGVLAEERDNLREEVEDARRPQMEEDAEFIAARTDRFGEDAEEVIENLDADVDEVAEKRELVEDLTEGYDEQTANSGDGGNEGGTRTTQKYARTPWE